MEVTTMLPAQENLRRPLQNSTECEYHGKSFNYSPWRTRHQASSHSIYWRPKPSVHSTAVMSIARSFSTERYLGKSNKLKHVCATGSRIVGSSPWRCTSNGKSWRPPPC